MTSMISRFRVAVTLMLMTDLLSISAIVPAHACELTCQELSRHQTGDKGGGCFGLESDDPVSRCEAMPEASYRLYAGAGCTGPEVASGKGRSGFDPPARVASVKLACPPGT